MRKIVIALLALGLGFGLSTAALAQAQNTRPATVQKVKRNPACPYGFAACVGYVQSKGDVRGAPFICRKRCGG